MDDLSLSSSTPGDGESGDSKHDCHLLKLPAELRNYIYELAIVQPSGIVIGPWRKLPPSKEPQKQPALTRTCRQVRSEALPIFYGKNVLELEIASITLRSYEGPPGFRVHIPAIHVPKLTRIRVLRSAGGRTYYDLDLTAGSEADRLVAVVADREFEPWFEDKRDRGREYLHSTLTSYKQGLSESVLMDLLAILDRGYG